MKSLKTGPVLCGLLSPSGLYGLYFLSTLLLGVPYLAPTMLMLIYFSIIVQGCGVILTVTFIFLENFFPKHPKSAPWREILSTSFISQLACWPLFFLHGEYMMMFPFAIRRGIIDFPTKNQIDLNYSVLLYLLSVLLIPALMVVLGLFLFLWRSRRPYREKCNAFAVFVCTFNVVLALNASGFVSVPIELLSLFWLLPTIAMFAYLAADTKPKCAALEEGSNPPSDK